MTISVAVTVLNMMSFCSQVKGVMCNINFISFGSCWLSTFTAGRGRCEAGVRGHQRVFSWNSHSSTQTWSSTPQPENVHYRSLPLRINQFHPYLLENYSLKLRPVESVFIIHPCSCYDDMMQFIVVVVLHESQHLKVIFFSLEQ